MGTLNDLPFFKPTLRAVKRGVNDKFIKPPYISGKLVVVDYYFHKDHHMTPIQEEAWQRDEIDSPAIWYVIVYALGSNAVLDDPSKDDLLFPDEVKDLFTTFWQIRLAMGHESCVGALEDAKEAWYWYKRASDIAF